MKLFEEVKLRNLSIKNRIVRSATHSMLGNLDGSISGKELDMFEELAANDIGLIIAGQFFVTEGGIVAPGSNLLSDDLFIGKVAAIAERVKKYDTKVIAQLNHAGAQTYNSEECFAPSAIKIGDGRIAREITLEEIEALKEAFINSAYRARQAGLHGVQIHAAHDYLLCEFLTPEYNKREDKYGRSAEGRRLIVEEILVGIKEKCGEEFPVFIKVNSNVKKNNREYQQDLKDLVKSLEELGIEAVEFSGYKVSEQAKDRYNYYLEDALRAKGSTDVRTILVGGIDNFNAMEEAINSGMDMVALSRALICEGDLITKLKNGQEKARCVRCNMCYTAGSKRCILPKN